MKVNKCVQKKDKALTLKFNLDERTAKKIKTLAGKDGLELGAWMVREFEAMYSQAPAALDAAGKDLMRVRKPSRKPQYRWFTVKMRLGLFDQARLAVMLDKAESVTLSQFLSSHLRITLDKLFSKLTPDEQMKIHEKLDFYFKNGEKELPARSTSGKIKQKGGVK